MALVRMPRQSWVAVWAVLGLVGALLAVGSVQPAGAATETADYEATYSACVGPALESQGLTDIEGSFAEDAVNCLGHYKVTTGRTETTYDPGSPVTRWQMALFLTRAAVPAGLPLMADPDQGFTDIAGRNAETVAAINQMAALEIMPGTSSTTFSPNNLVSRAQMASMLDAFLGKATLGSGALGGEEDSLSDITVDDGNLFTDIDQVTRVEYSAIGRMYEVGVARGTSEDQFSPGGLVTRAQMAVFITRMLAHTVARPSGVTLQSSADSVTTNNSVELAISVRGDDLMAVPDAVIDAFQATDADEAFGADGRCVTDSVSATMGSGVCEVAFGDEVTDPSGDLLYEVNLETDSVTIWAWTGDVGDRYDADDVTATSIEVEVTKPGIELKVTDDMPDNAEDTKFGETVTFTVQVVDEDGAAVALEDVAFTVSTTVTVMSNEQGATPTSNASSSRYMTGEDGSVSLEFTQADPRTGSSNLNDVTRLDLDVYPGAKDGRTFAVDDDTTRGNAGVDLLTEAEAAVVWRDVAAVPSVLKLTQAVEYHEASETGRGPANTVVATLTDQYGDPVARQVIEFTSDDVNGIGAHQAGDEGRNKGLIFSPATSEGLRLFTGSSRLTRTTNRRGVASMTYQRDSSADGVETIMAIARMGTTTTADDITADRVYHYWATEPAVGGTAEGRILVADTENNTLVLGGQGLAISMVRYDENDQLNATTGAVVLSDYEDDLTDSDAPARYLTVTNYQSASKNVSRFVSKGEAIEMVASYPAISYNPGSATTYANRVAPAVANVSAAMLYSTGPEAWYGHSFAAGGGVLVVGAPEEDAQGGVTGAGKVYIYDTFGDETPVVMGVATPANGQMFGYSVAVSDDGNVVAIGRPGSTDESVLVHQKAAGQDWATALGAFQDDSTSTSGSTKLALPTGNYGQSGRGSQAAPARRFGESIAISGNGRAITVGAPKDNRAPRSNSGLAFVYEPDSGETWNQQADAWAMADVGIPHTEERETDSSHIAAGQNTVPNFGGYGAMAMSEDERFLVVGAPEADLDIYPSFDDPESTKEDAGAIYVWDNTGNPNWANWGNVVIPDFKLIAGEGTAGEMLGAAVDITDDGTTIVATAPGSGKVYVFTSFNGIDNRGTWQAVGWRPRVLTADQQEANVFVLSHSTADPARPASAPLAANNLAIKKDGSEIVVGYSDRSEGDWRGSVLVYTRPAGGWADMADPTQEWIGTEANQRLGWQIAYDQSNGDIYASGYKPAYTGEAGARTIEDVEYAIYRIDRNN